MSTGGGNRGELKRSVICYRRKSGVKSTAPRKKCCPGNCCFAVPKRRRPEDSPLRFLKNLRDRAITALCMVSLRKKASPKISSLEKSTPSSDSHRSESVEACIQYINSSSSSSTSTSSTSSSTSSSCSTTSSSSSSSRSEPNPNTAVPKSK